MSTSVNRLSPLITPPDSKRRAKAFAIATSAAAAVLVLIGSVALLSRSGVEEIAPAAPPADVTLLEGTWERTVIESLDPLVHFVALELDATDFGLVAAAMMEGVWISEDGVEWRQALAVPHEPSALSPDTTTPSMTIAKPAGLVESYVQFVAEHDGALYAAGSMATGINTPDMESRVIVWRSEDGRRWDEITLNSERGGFAGRPYAMLSDSDVLLVYMEDGSVYRSGDGEAWTRFDNEQTGITTALTAVVQYGDEYVGISETVVGGNDISFVATSPNGITWTRVPGSDFPVGQHPYAPLVEFDGVLYVGGATFIDSDDGGEVGALWTSTDGRAFTEVDVGVRAPFGTSGDDELTEMYAVEDLIVTPHGMLVVGHVPGSAGNHQDIVLFATEDGITYEPVPDSDGLFTDAVQTSGAFFDDRVVMVGHGLYSETSDGLAYQWVWSP